MSKLENLFFMKRDKEIMEEYRKIQELNKTKEALSKASGIHDEIVIEKFIKLNISPEEAASISVAPLILVAWADGKIDKEEKTSILSSIEKMGWVQDTFDYNLVKRWLEYKPGAELLDAWLHYVKGLCGEMTSNEIEHFKNEIIEHAEAVAKASGGIFGIAKKSGAEEDMIAKLKNAFKVCKE